METSTTKGIYGVYQIIAGVLVAFFLGMIIMLVAHFPVFRLIISSDGIEEINTLAQAGINNNITGAIVFGAISGVLLLFIIAGPLAKLAIGAIYDELARHDRLAQEETQSN